MCMQTYPPRARREGVSRIEIGARTKTYASVEPSVENMSLLIPSKAPTGARPTSRRRSPR